ncbi:MAG TPA: VTT domain-containing protein [Thermoanaerobaculia bacterium]|jgi:membrane protein DedA with SNARE-associated domain|nr:VTT domain-containing protein [Thermoanaerobaculia bacterium]
MHPLLLQLARHGFAIVLGNVLLERLGLPIPALPTLIAAGALAAEGRLSGLGILFCGAFAALAADLGWFLLGRTRGGRILKTVCKVSLSPDSCVRQTELLFERSGMRSLLFAKFIPGYSMVAPPLAGAMGASVLSFLLWDGAGNLLWAGLGVGAGLLFHGAVDRLLGLLSTLGLWALVVLGVALGLFILWKWWERRRFFQSLALARIPPAELQELIGAARLPLIVDVRTETALLVDPRRIPGALRMTLDEIGTKLDGLPRDRDIILYCT